MPQNTLFAHLATKFAASPENLATEALGYVLNRSAPVRRAMSAFGARFGVASAEELIYSTQVPLPGGSGIADLVGSSASMVPRLIIEAKFWAGLTENQPVNYLGALEGGEGGVLMFICPERRVPTLWPELVLRCREGGLEVRPAPLGDAVASVRAAAAGEKTRLGLASWRALIQRLTTAAEGAGESASASDLHQLSGLCERMDAEAFLPIRPEELGPENPRRIRQLCSLIDDVVSNLVAEGFASTTGFKASSGAGWYGRYFSAGKVGALLHVSAELWSREAETPVWLRLKEILHPEISDSDNWTKTAALVNAIAMLTEFPGQVVESNTHFDIALRLPTGVERDRVLRGVRDQVHGMISSVQSALGPLKGM